MTGRNATGLARFVILALSACSPRSSRVQVYPCVTAEKQAAPVPKKKPTLSTSNNSQVETRPQPHVGEWQRTMVPLAWTGERFTGQFGEAVAYDGKAVVVGGASDDRTQPSAVYVFEPRRGHNDAIRGMHWVGRYVLNGGSTAIGWSVRACNRGFIVSTSVGSALWFAKGMAGWKMAQELRGPGVLHLQEFPVACASTRAIFAAAQSDQHFVVAFSWRENSWISTTTVRLESRASAFGFFGDLVVVGLNGRVRLFETKQQWKEIVSFQVPGEPVATAMNNDWLFVAVAPVGISDRNNVRMYRRQGTTWVPAGELAGTPGAISMAISNETLVIGDSSVEHSGPAQGAVRVYSHRRNQWVWVGTVVPNTSIDYQLFGARLALANDELVISAPGGTNVAGAVYIVDLLADTRGKKSEGRWQVVARKRLFPYIYDHGAYVSP